jgi:hypothetical protein
LCRCSLGHANWQAGTPAAGDSGGAVVGRRWAGLQLQVKPVWAGVGRGAHLDFKA